MPHADAKTWFPEDRAFITPDTYDAFFAVVDRLEAVIEAETRQLAAGGRLELGDPTRHKRQGFLELNRILKTMERAIPSEDILSRLAVFRSRLAANDAALRVHLQAVRAVNKLIVKVMRESESDGTYSRGSVHAAYDDA